MKKLLSLVSCLVFSLNVNATQLNVDGVHWNSDSSFDFNGVISNISQTMNVSTKALSGFGKIAALNNDPNFCPECELTFVYSDYRSQSLLMLGSTQYVQYTNGIINLYVDNTPDAPLYGGPGLTSRNTSDGKLWLSLVGHNSFDGAGQLNSSHHFYNLSAMGLWDVVGGSAASYFDTNLKTDGADFSFVSSFTTGIITTLYNGVYLPSSAYGTASFSGKTMQEVDEPSVIILFIAVLIMLIGSTTYNPRKYVM